MLPPEKHWCPRLTLMGCEDLGSAWCLSEASLSNGIMDDVPVLERLQVPSAWRSPCLLVW